MNVNSKTIDFSKNQKMPHFIDKDNYENLPEMGRSRLSNARNHRQKSIDFSFLKSPIKNRNGDYNNVSVDWNSRQSSQ